ncbi:MAG: hypothetical protein RSA86_07730, partial [Christensenellaceae bacterium]
TKKPVKEGEQIALFFCVKIEKIPFEQAVQMVLTGEIKDAKTQICLLKAYLMLDALGREQTVKKEI